MSIEQSFVMLKPGAVQRKLVGKVMSRFEEKGLKLVGLKMLNISRELAETHYKIHEGKHFFNKLINYITASPVVASVWEGENAVKIIRRLIGETDPLEAAPGSIRGDYALNVTLNIVHASDGPETAAQEIDLFFNKDEIVDYEQSLNGWILPENF